MADHKMKDLGEKRKEFYHGPEIAENKEPKIVYQEISLPLKIIEGMDIKVDDEVTVTVKGRVSGTQDTKWNKSITIEAKQGEVIKDSKGKEKKE